MKSKIKFVTGEFSFNQVVKENIVRNQEGDMIDIQTEREKVTVPPINIEVETEYAPSEILDYWNITKTIMKEAPEEFKNFMIALTKAYQESETVVSDIVGGTKNGEEIN